VVDSGEHCNDPAGSVNEGEVIDQLSYSQLLNNSAYGIIFIIATVLQNLTKPNREIPGSNYGPQTVYSA
jgi:hypothetical protein